MINNETNEVIKELFQLLLTSHQTSLETSKNDRDFVFDSLMDYTKNITI